MASHRMSDREIEDEINEANAIAKAEENDSFEIDDYSSSPEAQAWKDYQDKNK